MGSGCPMDIYMTKIAFKPWKVTSVVNVLPWKLNSNYTFSSASSNSVFDTPDNTGRGFAPYAIARVTDPTTSFCLKCNIQIENLDTNPLKIPFMTGIAIIDSNMNKIYEAGIGSLETPGVFDTIPKKRLLPVPLNTITRISLSMYENKVTFFNGEKSIEQNLTITSPTTLYVALFMRGRGYYKTIFTDVICSGLTAMSSVPTISPSPNNKYLHLSAASTDAEIISTGNVSSVSECKQICDIVEQCTGFDIVTSTNFCTLRKIVQSLPENDVYADSPSDVQTIQPFYISSADIVGKWNTVRDKVINAIHYVIDFPNQVGNTIAAVIAAMALSTLKTKLDQLRDTVVNSLTGNSFTPSSISTIYAQFSDVNTEYNNLDATFDLSQIGDAIDEVGDAIDDANSVYSPIIINNVAFDSNGEYMAVCNGTTAIKLYKKTTLSLTLTAASPVAFVIFDDQNNIICATSAHGIQKFTRNVADGTYPNTTSAQVNATNNVTKMAMDDSGNFMVIQNSSTKNVKVLKLQTDGSYDPVFTLPTTSDYDSTCTISKYGKYIAASILQTNTTVVKIYNIANNNNFIDTVQDKGTCVNLIFDPSEKNEDVLFVCTTKKIVICKRQASNFTKQYEIKLPEEILHTSFDPSGIYLAVACLGGKLYVLRKQGNKTFIFTKSFNTAIELSYPLPALAQYIEALAQYNQDIKKVKVQFNPSLSGELCVASPYGNVKIFKKLKSEEPTRFESPSPRGVDTYLKVHNSILENLYIRISFSRTDPRGGGLKKVLNSFTPTLDISTLIIDCSSGRPDYLIIEDNFNNFYSGAFRYKAITYPSSTQTPILAFAFTIENRNDFTNKTFYILTDTISFKKYSIINDLGESVTDMPENLGISYDKVPSPVNTLTSIQKNSLFFSSPTEKWYRSNLLNDIMAFPIPSNQETSISYDYTTKILTCINQTITTNISCDIEIKNHKITFKTNTTTSMSPSPIPGTLIAVFFIIEIKPSTITIMLTYVDQSFYTNFNISLDADGIPLKNLIYTKNNNIDTPYYYKLTEVYDPMNPYLEIDDKVVYALSKTSDRLLPIYENTLIPNISLLLYGKKFISYPNQNHYIEFLDDITLTINGDRTFNYFSYSGIVIFVDKYGTVNVLIMKTTTVNYITIKRYIYSEFFLDDKTIEYTLENGVRQIIDNVFYTSIGYEGYKRLKIRVKESEVDYGFTTDGGITFTSQINKIYFQGIDTTNKFIYYNTDQANLTVKYRYKGDIWSGQHYIGYVDSGTEYGFIPP